MSPLSLFEKLWRAHTIVTQDEHALLFIDRHFLHEGSFHAFNRLWALGRQPRRPDLTVTFADHYVPTKDRSQPIADPEIARMVSLLAENSQRAGIRAIGLDHPDQGIVHVVAPELGLSLPGTTIVCGDSHTSSHGAYGALAFGIGASEVAHVLATQTLWQRRPASMRVRLDGTLPAGVDAKDMILAIIATIGANGAGGAVIEYAGSAVTRLSMAGRLTLCNMSIEAGARAGMIAPDDTTIEALSHTPFAPKGADWDTALAAWRAMPSDPGAGFDREADLDVSRLAPMVTWGTSPETAVSITTSIPSPRTEADRRALAYMALSPGEALDGLPVDRVFIGSCTNARLEDLTAAAAVLAGRRVAVETWVVPGSQAVTRRAEAEGALSILAAAGVEIRAPGCSMCAGTNGDIALPGQRVAATSNRNFEGRQGRGVRTHLMGPAMAAAAAATGRITDVRRFL
ncbi:MAG: 3-isopropylmalate dehydratase large subunit [Alphaproteobacteria bacterium]|nr:3-isopropylmalate dehydratase large subunit [Alphaproteobacteria bacterium]